MKGRNKMSMNYQNTTLSPQTSLKDGIQRFGRLLSGMVLPNIGAFIAWGLITVLFIGPGWLPNPALAQLVGPMLKALLPILIGYTGGRALGGQRGAVVGAVATFGIMMGAGGAKNLADGTPMFLGAMMVGPLGGYITKKIETATLGKIPAGFEMLFNNFSDGIVGMLMACVGLLAFGPLVAAATAVFGDVVKVIVKAGFLPLASVFIEPAKILFLNNAINHGVLSPLGIQQAAETGKSIFFMLESNPGPGLGILLAYAVFSKGMAKQSAPGAIIIHFLGGIHEIYFPYILMNPILLVAVIAGGISGVFTFGILGAGLIAPPSPGSIFIYIIMSPKGGLIPIMIGVLISAAVSFLLASLFIKMSKEFYGADLKDARTTVKEMKAASKGLAIPAAVQKIIFACDAGMGSSAMGASTLRGKLKKAGLGIEVANCAIEDIPSDADIVITHESLSERAKSSAPHAEHIAIQNFINSPEYDELVKRLS
jgi:PTS system mannitol-specific IIC component